MHPQRSLEQSHKDFLNPSMELRRIFAEAWGTFLLVVVAAGSHIVSHEITPAMASVASGLIVMSVIYFMGSVSGAHINPAVTLAFAIRRNFPWKRVPGYLLGQFLGGILAVNFLKMYGSIEAGATIPHVESWKAFMMEVLLTTGLVNIILGTATGARNIGHNGAIAIGGYIVLSGLWAEPVSGASMNPARSVSVDLVSGHLTTTWIYILAPLMGALIAVIFEWILKGNPTQQGTEAAQGSDGYISDA